MVALVVSIGYATLFPQQAKQVATNVLGAIPGTSVDGNYFAIGGVEYYHFKTNIAASSTVPCYVRPNPFGSATTSVEMASFQPTAGTNGAFTFDFATTTSAGGYGTSTPALARAVSVAAVPTRPFVYALATTTTAFTIGRAVGVDASDGSMSNVFVKPGEGLVFRIATGTPGTIAVPLTGTCEVVLRKL